MRILPVMINRAGVGGGRGINVWGKSPPPPSIGGGGGLNPRDVIFTTFPNLTTRRKGFSPYRGDFGVMSKFHSAWPPRATIAMCGPRL